NSSKSPSTSVEGLFAFPERRSGMDHGWVTGEAIRAIRGSSLTSGPEKQKALPPKWKGFLKS
ncbi:MAG TPA: hypothetical protein VNB29_07035, partial [Chthoniobacterales bacterium]|nr:hypothetical protein [Chthoniobacterales bacterium]